MSANRSIHVGALGVLVALSVAADRWTQERRPDGADLRALSDLKVPGGARNQSKSARELLRESFERVECFAAVGRVKECDQACQLTRAIAARTGVALSKEDESALNAAFVEARLHSVDRLLSQAGESQKRHRYDHMMKTLVEARSNYEAIGMPYSSAQEARVKELLQDATLDLPFAIFDNDNLALPAAMGSVETVDEEIRGICAFARAASVTLTKQQQLFLENLSLETRRCHVTTRIFELAEALTSSEVPSCWLDDPSSYFSNIASAVEQRAKESGTTLTSEQQRIVREARLRAAQLRQDQ